jgi:BirA family biotin operon repressor/biotin-[acetyl-CoA-carboxylase] ligase
MVNKKTAKPSTKGRLLEALRLSAGGRISGSELGRRLGVSRVAVWKAAQSLKMAGYPIGEDDRGYRIDPENPGDFLYPWEFGEREGDFYYYASTDSTMNRARELAERGAGDTAVITAETQTLGRGRNGHSWVSGKGGLFFSLLERPAIWPNYRPVGEYSLMTMTVHLAMARAISRFCGKEALLRWPNDVYLGNKKIAGLLAELSAEGDRIRWLSLGMGVNINNRFPEQSTSCADILGHPVSRRELLLGILSAYGDLKKAALSPGELRRHWNHHAYGLGSRVGVSLTTPVRGTRRRITGTFLGIDPQGRAIIGGETGEKRFSPASASLQFFQFDQGKL